MSTLSDKRLVLTPDEVCPILHMGRSAVYEAIRRGDIPTIRIGRRWLIPKAALNRMLSEAGAEPLSDISSPV